jgi:hypothetical protein
MVAGAMIKGREAVTLEVHPSYKIAKGITSHYHKRVFWASNGSTSARIGLIIDDLKGVNTLREYGR